VSNNPRRIKRQSIRLDGHDYSQAGAYFTTLVTYQRECLFGKVIEDKIELSAFGKIAQIEWFRSASIRNEIDLHEDEFVVMPNHIHGIVWITASAKSRGVGGCPKDLFRQPPTRSA
jgi:putative transposase